MVLSERRQRFHRCNYNETRFRYNFESIYSSDRIIRQPHRIINNCLLCARCLTVAMAHSFMLCTIYVRTYTIRVYGQPVFVLCAATNWTILMNGMKSWAVVIDNKVKCAPISVVNSSFEPYLLSLRIFVYDHIDSVYQSMIIDSAGAVFDVSKFFSI